jgi:hypothetical protein
MAKGTPLMTAFGYIITPGANEFSEYTYLRAIFRLFDDKITIYWFRNTSLWEEATQEERAECLNKCDNPSGGLLGKLKFGCYEISFKDISEVSLKLVDEKKQHEETKEEGGLFGALKKNLAIRDPRIHRGTVSLKMTKPSLNLINRGGFNTYKVYFDRNQQDNFIKIHSMISEILHKSGMPSNNIAIKDSGVRFCTQCGASVKADDNYCIKCGNKLK